jgi:hypothetical protein
MKDERIETTVNRFAARGFYIWIVLMLFSLCYRLLILRQHPKEWWDIFAIFLIGTFYVYIGHAKNGVLDSHLFKWKTMTVGITCAAIAAIFVSQYITGRTFSVAEVGLFLIGFLPSMGLITGITYFLNRRWKQKEGLEDEK